MIIDKKNTNLNDVLKFRDYKANTIKFYLERYPSCNIISFGLNIPGSNKISDSAFKVFSAGISQIKSALLDLDVIGVNSKRIEDVAGNCMILAVKGRSASEIKNAMITIEDNHPLGRIFDIDVFNSKGESISRESLNIPPRSCFLCKKYAKDCGRNQTHRRQELNAYVTGLINDYFYGMNL